MPGPVDPIKHLVDAVNHGDLQRALTVYGPDSVFVAQPGQVARGLGQIKEALAGFIALKPTLTFQSQETIEAGDIALCAGRWTLTGTDPAGKPVTMGGESADVLRRQPDGRWLIAVDNPWGTAILEPKK